jgi:hypothetical protein
VPPEDNLTKRTRFTFEVDEALASNSKTKVRPGAYAGDDLQ